MEIAVADLSAPDVQALLAAHLSAMRAGSPPESVHALDLTGLQHPDVTVWAARDAGTLAGVGALKRLDAARGEIKSMRVADAFLGRGVGRALLRHLVAAARAQGMTSVWLETGSGEEFAAARGLYAGEGFAECGPFGDYVLDPLSVYFRREL